MELAISDNILQQIIKKGVSIFKMGRETYYSDRIERLRKELHRSGIENGLTHEKTVLLSKTLDQILNKYTKLQFEKLS